MVTGVIGGVLGLAPHLLHHIGLLAGTALVAGSGGTALFAVVDIVATVPMLLRLRRRFDNWLALTMGLAVFAAMFALSAFVIGPAVSGSQAGSLVPSPSNGHSSHDR